DLGEEVLAVALDDTGREVDHARPVRAGAREVLAAEEPLDRLRLRRRQVPAVRVEEEDVDDPRVEGRATDVDPARLPAVVDRVPDHRDRHLAQVLDVHADRHEARDHRAVDHPRRAVGVPRRRDVRAGSEHRAVRAAQAGDDLGRQLRVRDPADPRSVEEAPLPRLAPDQRMREDRALFDDLVRPDLDVRADDREGADLGPVRKDRVLPHLRALADADARAEDRLVDPRAGPHDAPLPQDHIVQLRAIADLHAIADDHVLQDDAAPDPRTDPEDGGADEAGAALDPRARLAPDDALLVRPPLAAERDRDAAGEDVQVRAPVLGKVPDVAPVPV